MESKLIPKKRPLAISIICIIGFLGSFYVVPQIFESICDPTRFWYPFYLAINAIFGLINMIGLWRMKRWAAITYISLTILNQIVLFFTGLWSFSSLFIPAIVIVFILFYVADMSK